MSNERERVLMFWWAVFLSIGLIFTFVTYRSQEKQLKEAQQKLEKINSVVNKTPDLYSTDGMAYIRELLK